MNYAYLIVFGYVPYIAVAIFIVGIIFRLVRWLMPKALTGLYNVNATVNDDSYGKITIEILKRIFLFYTLPGTDTALFVAQYSFTGVLDSPRGPPRPINTACAARGHGHFTCNACVIG